MGGVNADGDEYVECLDSRDINGDEAGVGVVDEEVTGEGACREVIDAASAIGHIAHDDRFGPGTKGLDYVRYCTCEEEEPFGHLQADAGRAGFADVVDCLVDFEVVVGGEEGDGGIEGWVVEDFRWNLVYCAAAYSAGLG